MAISCQDYLKKSEYRKYYKEEKCKNELILDNKEKPCVKQLLNFQNLAEFQEWAVNIKKASDITIFFKRNVDLYNTVKEVLYREIWTHIKEIFEDVSLDDYLKTVTHKYGFDSLLKQLLSKDAHFSIRQQKQGDAANM